MKAFIKAMCISLICMLFSACDKSLLDVDFTYTAKSMTFQIDSTTQGKVLALDTVLIDNTSFDSVVKANKAQKSDIESIKISSITVVPDSGRDDIFQSLDGYLVADGLSEQKIMHANYAATIQAGINPIIYDVQLLDYINKPSMKFRAVAVAGVNTKEISKVKITIKYKITAKI